MEKEKLTDQFIDEMSGLYSVGQVVWRTLEFQKIADHEFKYPLLDVGCGDGNLMAILDNKIKKRNGDKTEIYGTDVLPVACDLAKKTDLYKEARLVDSAAIPFESDFFAQAFSNCVFEHIPALEETLKELRRVLRPGGELFFTALSDFYPKNLFYARFFRKLKLNFLADLYIKTANGIFKHYHCPSKKEWEEMLNRAGFRIKNIEYSHSRKMEEIFDLLLPLSAIQQFFVRTIRRVPLRRINRFLSKKILDSIKGAEERSGMEGGANVTILAEKI